MVDEFDKILPREIIDAAVRNGNEWVIPFPEVIDAIKLANGHLIAVLRVDVFEFIADRLLVDGISAYEFHLEGNWSA